MSTVDEPKDELVLVSLVTFELDGEALELYSEHLRSRMHGLDALSLLGLESGETDAVDAADVVKASGTSWMDCCQGKKRRKLKYW